MYFMFVHCPCGSYTRQIESYLPKRHISPQNNINKTKISPKMKENFPQCLLVSVLENNIRAESHLQRNQH